MMMRYTCRALEGVRFMVVGVRRLDLFRDREFMCILDKSTMGSVFCGLGCVDYPIAYGHLAVPGARTLWPPACSSSRTGQVTAHEIEITRYCPLYLRCDGFWWDVDCVVLAATGRCTAIGGGVAAVAVAVVLAQHRCRQRRW